MWTWVIESKLDGRWNGRGVKLTELEANIDAKMAFRNMCEQFGVPPPDLKITNEPTGIS